MVDLSQLTKNLQEPKWCCIASSWSAERARSVLPIPPGPRMMQASPAMVALTSAFFFSTRPMNMFGLGGSLVGWNALLDGESQQSYDVGEGQSYIPSRNNTSLETRKRMVEFTKFHSLVSTYRVLLQVHSSTHRSTHPAQTTVHSASV